MNDMSDESFNDKNNAGQKSLQVALIPLKAGCLTFALAGVAILVGLWLDTRLGTTPRWTLILLVGSAPFTLGGVFLIARRALGRIQTDRDSVKHEQEM